MARVRARKDQKRNGKKVYYVDYKDHLGKRVRKTIGTDKKQAQKVAAKIETQLNEGKYFDIGKEHKIRYEKVLDRYLQEYSPAHHAPRTSERHFTSSKHLRPFFANLLLKDLKPDKIYGYISKRKQSGAKPATINRELNLLRHTLRLAQQWEWLRRHPMNDIKPLKEPPGRVRYLKPEEIQRLFAELPEYLHPIVTFAMNTGMRKDEILGLTWNRVFLEQRHVVIDRTKNGERRSVPLNMSALNVLEEMMALHQTDIEYVFWNPETRNRWIDIHHAFHRACKKAMIEDFRFHDLRHTAASYMVMNGVALASVQQILGHKTLDMTLRYSHLSPEYNLNSVKALDQTYGKLLDSENSQKSDPLVTDLSQRGLMVSRTIKEEELSLEDNEEKVAGETGLEPATLGFGDQEVDESDDG